MSKRRRCTATHPETGARCQKREHPYPTPHRIWRRRKPEDEITWGRVNPARLTPPTAAGSARATLSGLVPSASPRPRGRRVAAGRYEPAELDPEDQAGA